MQFLVDTMPLYMVLINLVSGVLFSYDKNAAKHNRRRISEQTLHLLEVLGGVFAIILLMYILHHKNRKFSYWVWTWLVLIGWGIITFIFVPIYIIN